MAPTSTPSSADIAYESSNILAGVGIVAVALFPLAVPLIVLTAVALLPFLIPPLALGLVAAVIAAPVLLVRRLLGRRATRQAMSSRPSPGLQIQNPV